MQSNICNNTDAYKLTQHLMYRKDLNGISSYAENRKGAIFPDAIFFSLQMILIDNLEGQVVTEKKILDAQKRSERRFGTARYFNKDMWYHILHKHDGRLPLEIKAVPEGSRVPISNVLYSIDATDEKCVPLVQHVETLLMRFWYGQQVATDIFYIRQYLRRMLEKNGDESMLPYMLHNFGARAATCDQASMISGMAHGLIFDGSDTEMAEEGLEYYYGMKDSNIRSVFATEHSCALQYGPGEGEIRYVLAALEAAGDDRIASIVIDTYDADNFIDNVITHPDVMRRINLRTAKAVWRQDSGDALRNSLRNLDSLSRSFGYDYIKGNYRLLNSKVGLLQGDNMKRTSIPALYDGLDAMGWSSSNLITGSGSGIVQTDMYRDALRVAIKPSVMSFSGIEYPVQKKVISQPDKASKPGRLKLHKVGREYMTISSANEQPAAFAGYHDCMRPVFRNGELLNKMTFSEIVENINNHE